MSTRQFLRAQLRGFWSQWLAALAISSVWVWWLYGQLLDAWWARDDAQILHYVRRTSPADWFSSPSIWREFSATHFTPLLPLSYALDHALFGLNPAGFYAHTLVILVITMLLGFGLLRSWIGAGWALLFALLVAASPPVLTELHGLPRRHYVLGLLFTTLTLQLYIKAVRHDRWSLAWLSALSCALAMLSKELYIPLAGVLPWLPIGSARRRWRLVLPSAVVAALVVLWRGTMLGAAVGGTGRDINVDALLQVPLRISQLSFGKDTLGVAVGVLSAGLALSFVVRRASARSVSFFAVGAALAPLVFILPLGTPKLLILVVWLILLAATAELSALAARGTRQRVFALAGAALLTLGVLAESRALGTRESARLREFERQGRFMMEADAKHVLWSDLPDHYLRHLALLRADALGQTAPLYASDEIQLAAVDLSTHTVVEDDAEREVLRDISTDFLEHLKAWRRTIRQRELSIDFSVRGGLVHWRFGPWGRGGWKLIEHVEFGPRALPRSGSGRVNLGGTLHFQVRYDSPEGWTTYSERLDLDLVEGARLNWQRPRLGSDQN